MTTLREFLQNDPLISADAKLKEQEGLEFFSEFLIDTVQPIWLRVLSNFTRNAPLRYWDRVAIQKGLEVLEADKQRTLEALAEWKNRIGIGFEYLFRRATIERYEENLTTTKSSDLLLLANEFHPEYLRRCESVYTNIITLYWAILKKKSVQGKFEITGALSLLKAKGYKVLTSGYEENVRNGIAHGQVVFEWDEIKYGENRSLYKLEINEFLKLFDEIFRTSNSLAISILIFLANNQILLSKTKNILPTSIIILIASAHVERQDFKVLGIVESQLSKDISQLHISMKTGFINRTAVMLDCARAALRLFDAGATSYSRYLFEIHQENGVDSLLGIKPGTT